MIKIKLPCGTRVEIKEGSIIKGLYDIGEDVKVIEVLSPHTRTQQLTVAAIGLETYTLYFLEFEIERK